MKKLFFICSLITIHCSLFGQSWLWVRQGINNNDSSYGDPWAIAADSAGNVIETGGFTGSINFGLDNIHTAPFNIDAFMVKYDPVGNVLWASAPKLGHSSISFATSASTDSSGNIYIAGYYTDTVQFGSYRLTGPLYGPYFTTGNTFLVKYKSNGTVAWAVSSVQPSLTSLSQAETVVTDNTGNIYVGGVFKDSVGFGAYTLFTSNPNNQGIFIVKYSSLGNVIWAASGEITNYFVPSTQPTICIDSGHNIYLSGGFVNKLSFGSVIMNTTSLGSFFLVKIDSSGNAVWGRNGIVIGMGQVPGNIYNKIPCALDKAGNIYVGGCYRDSLQIGPYLFKNKDYATSSLFLAKYNPSGNLLWAENSSEVADYLLSCDAYSLSPGKDNNLYFSGDFNDTISFANTTLINDSMDLNNPSFLMEIDTSGKAICSAVITNFNDDNNAVVADPMANNVYLTGDVANNACVFGDTTLYGTFEWPFLIKWSCDSNKCTLTANLTGTKDICEGSTDVLSASGGSSYLWSNGATTQNIVISPSVNTEYSVLVSNGNCSVTDSINITVHPSPVVTVCCDTVIEQGQSVSLDATGGTDYSWIPTAGLSSTVIANPIADPEESIWYYVTITDSNGCSTIDSVLITVREKPCGQIFIPDAFSPNNDGQNDILYVRGDCINTMDFVVFDRWGNKVFESESKSVGWDGRYAGKPMNTGTYVWYLKATLNDGSTVEKKGNVALVR